MIVIGLLVAMAFMFVLTRVFILAFFPDSFKPQTAQNVALAVGFIVPMAIFIAAAVI